MVNLSVEKTSIPGLTVVRLPLHQDHRGWFKENWQREKMVALGLPDFGPVQNNVSYNAHAGATRGFHAEPWDKFVSVLSGRVFGAWADLRAGDTFGSVFTVELGPETAVFVPRGVANAFQTLEDESVYSYLVNEHWSESARSSYTFVNLADERLAIRWPIPLDRAELSHADRTHPRLEAVRPMPQRQTLILGAEGQLGRALRREIPHARTLSRAELDLADPHSLRMIDWSSVGVILNAAAYTAVDEAETTSGRRRAWSVNAQGPARLAALAREHRITLVHVSTDYVFDGEREKYSEDETFSPLGVYGQSKAAGDLAIAAVPCHYIVRTSWVVGDGPNFVRTMARLAERGVKPSVVNDQFGRLTFTDDLARGIRHLLDVGAPSGTYNLTCSGPIQTWADVARSVFARQGRLADEITEVSTEEYGVGKKLARRPRRSVLDLAKIKATGFSPSNPAEALNAYLKRNT